MDTAIETTTAAAQAELASSRPRPQTEPQSLVRTSPSERPESARGVCEVLLEAPSAR